MWQANPDYRGHNSLVCGAPVNFDGKAYPLLLVTLSRDRDNLELHVLNEFYKHRIKYRVLAHGKERARKDRENGQNSSSQIFRNRFHSFVIQSY